MQIFRFTILFCVTTIMGLYALMFKKLSNAAAPSF